jgi:hypothetical protein
MEAVRVGCWLLMRGGLELGNINTFEKKLVDIFDAYREERSRSI